MKWFLPFLLAISLAIPPAAQSQAPGHAPQTKKELDVPGNQPWTDTGVDLHQGQTVTITATGNLQYMDRNPPRPQGTARSWKDPVPAMPVNTAGRGALIGRLGSDDAGQPFLIGASIQFPVRVTGRLFLGINGPSGDSAKGSFHVKIEISSNASVSSPATTPSSNPSVPSGTSTGGSTLADSP